MEIIARGASFSWPKNFTFQLHWYTHMCSVCLQVSLHLVALVLIVVESVAGWVRRKDCIVLGGINNPGGIHVDACGIQIISFRVSYFVHFSECSVIIVVDLILVLGW